MGNYHQHNQSGEKRNFNDRGSDRRGSDRRGSDRRSSDRPTMHKAVCSSCGRECEIPFKPTGVRPIFCNSCFKSNDDSTPKRYDSPKRYDAPNRYDTHRPEKRANSRENQMHDGICDDCGAKCKLPFKPMPGKSIYCSDCFESKDPKSNQNTLSKNTSNKNSSSAEMVELKLEIDELNSKLDKILRLLAPDQAKAKPKAKVKPKAKSQKSRFNLGLTS